MNVFYIEGWLFLQNELNGEIVEKTFQHYPELPPELRRMIVDEMEPADRCRFGGCSKLSNKEAKSSKKYIYSLEFYGVSEENAQIQVIHGEYPYSTGRQNEIDTGFILDFRREHRKKYIRYLNSKNKEHWRIELDSSIDLPFFAANYFKTFLRCYQNTIRRLEISHRHYFDNELGDFNYEVAKLNNLEVLITSFKSNILDLYSKIRKPLKTLSVHGEENNRFLADHEFSDIEVSLDLVGLKLNNEQFLRLTAEEFSIHIGYLTERNIFNFVRSWQNGTVRKNFKRCSWRLSTHFDSQKLFNLFERNEQNPDALDGTVYVTHYKETERKAKLSCSNILIFETDVTQIEQESDDNDDDDE